MPRTNITPQAIPGGAIIAGIPVTFTAADLTDMNEARMKRGDIVLIRNVGTIAHAFTVDGVVDPFGRDGAITAQSLAAGDMVMFVVNHPEAWLRGGITLDFEGDNAEIEFAVLSV